MGKLLLSHRFSNIIIDFYFLLECAVVYQLLNVCLDTDAFSIRKVKMLVNRNWLQYVGWECADKFLSIMLGDLVVSCPIN